MMRRFSSMTLTGMVRCEVASGMARLGARLPRPKARFLRRVDGGVCPRISLRRARLLEHPLPAFVDRRVVVQILEIKLVLKPAIDTRFRIGFRRHGGHFFPHDSV